MADAGAQTVQRRIVELGFLSQEQLLDQLASYHEVKPPLEFPAYLYERGVLSSAQLDQLGVTLPPLALPGGPDPKLGATYSGCRIESKLGQGGMGTVYLARREADGQEVVVKFLAPDKAMRPNIRRRFQREGEVLQKVSGHPNIVAIYNVSSEAASEPHIVMEYVRGESLADVLKERWSLPPLEAARLARDTALGLAEVHAAEIIHRDVKPANLVLTEAGQIKILDFGLAKDLEASGITRPGQAVGTPNYMAPEQWGDHEVDARCDLFSLGSTLYHMVVGEPPFRGRNAPEVAKQILSGVYTPPSRVVADLPPDLELVIAQLLMVDRRFRYADAREAAEDLDRVVRGEPVQVPRLVEPGPRGRRYPLLPGTSFPLGRDAEAAVTIVHPTVSRKHAVVEREPGGFFLRDLGSTYGTFLRDTRVDRTPLRHGDTLRLGKVELQFLHEGQVEPEEASIPLPPGVAREEPPLPDPLLRGLVELRDPRTTLFLLEQLAPGSVRERAIAALETLFPQEARELHAELERRVRAARTRLPQLLIQVTRQELEDSPEAWLGWWDQARGQLPPQLVPIRPEPKARLRIVAGEPERQVVGLAPGDVFTIGRSASCHVRLTNRSVSRLHASVMRYWERFVIRDEGSRFGTNVAGRAGRLAFLEPGDRVVLGKVELVFELQEAEERVPRAGLGTYLVDPELFDVLLAREHPSVITALVTALHEEGRLSWIAREAQRLVGPVAGIDLRRAVERSYELRIRRARELLPKLLAVSGTRPVAAWRQLLAERRSSLPPQVVPMGFSLDR